MFDLISVCKKIIILSNSRSVINTVSAFKNLGINLKKESIENIISGEKCRVSFISRFSFRPGNKRVKTFPEAEISSKDIIEHTCKAIRKGYLIPDDLKRVGDLITLSALKALEGTNQWNIRREIFQNLSQYTPFTDIFSAENAKHILYLASAYFECTSECSDTCRKRIIAQKYDEARNESKNKNLLFIIWKKFAILAYSLGLEQLPDNMLKDTDAYIFDILLLCKSISKKQNIKETKEQVFYFATQAGQAVLKKDPRNHYALMILGVEYNSISEFGKARYYLRLADQNDLETKSVLLCGYKLEVKELLKAKDFNIDRIRCLNKILSELYYKIRKQMRNQIDSCDCPDEKTVKKYIDLCCENACFELKRYKFGFTKEILEEVSEISENYTVLLGKAYLLKDSDSKNKYYDREESLMFFTKAYESAPETDTYNRKRILSAMIDIYMETSQFDKAIDACKTLSDICPEDMNVKDKITEIEERIKMAA